MKHLVVKALRDIGLDTPNAEAVVAFRLTDPTLIYEYVHAVAEQLRSKDGTANDSRQLDLPGFEHVTIEAGETLEQYRAETAKLATRLKSYDYARRSPEKRKRDQVILRERLKLDARIAPLFAADPSMTVPQAIDRYRISLEAPARNQRRQAGPKDAKCRSGSSSSPRPSVPHDGAPSLISTSIQRMTQPPVRLIGSPFIPICKGF